MFLVCVISQLEAKFSIKGLGTFFFLGVEVILIANELFLSQHKYIQELLKKTQMVTTKPIQSSMSLNNVPHLHDDTSLLHPIEYRLVIGGF